MGNLLKYNTKEMRKIIGRGGNRRITLGLIVGAGRGDNKRIKKEWGQKRDYSVI